MRKGISPIVAVVLLIAIAVIAAVGLYFWVGGLATKQPTPNTPIVIGAQKVTCSPGAGNDTMIVLIQNLDASSNLAVPLYIAGDDGTLTNTSAVSISHSSQASVTFGTSGAYGGNLTSGHTYTIYGTSNVAQAQVVC